MSALSGKTQADTLFQKKGISIHQNLPIPVTKVSTLVSHAGTSKGQLDTALQSVRGSSASVDTDTADQKFEALQKYGTDLTAKAAQLDPIIGRDEEIRRCVRILCRRTKNNPVLIGDPGKHAGLRMGPIPPPEGLLACQRPGN